MDNNPIKTADSCPLKQEYCKLSCPFRQEDLCYFFSKRGRKTPEWQSDEATAKSEKREPVAQAGAGLPERA
ncbi:MAG: hypothetical protein IIB13_01415 [Chloroflexi bacterium]|nr:hypothetical protein [Chloroflexota bacterium]